VARALVLISVLVALPVVARAQVSGSVRLERSPCAFLPFSEDRLRELVDLELSVDGGRLDEDGDAVLRYALEPCEAGATAIRVEVVRDGATREGRVELADVPLATVPRALALELVVTLRSTVGPALQPADPAAIVEPEPQTSEAIPPAATPIVDAPSAPSHRMFRFTVLGGLRNTPDTGAVLTGARLSVDVWPTPDAPVVGRLDAGLSAGPASDALTLGAVEGGLTVSLWARAAPGFALRFGPRVWIAHGFDLDRPPELQAPAEDVMAGLGLRVGGELELGSGVVLVLEGEVGTHFAGLRYARAGEPPGIGPGMDGAYWALELGLGLE
jgi:hypothetical protein